MDQVLETLPPWVTLAVLLAATFTAASTGALFKPGAWYRTLAKPAWTPPDLLFPIVWTVLYVAMAVAAWRVLASPSPLAVTAIALWCWQLVLNALWSPVFFGLRRLGTGFAVIVLLWIAVALTTWTFAVVDPVAGWLLLPYLVWASYAGAVNLAVWRMNAGPAPGQAARV